MYLAFDLFQMPVQTLRQLFVEFSHSVFPDGIRQQHDVISLEDYLQYGPYPCLLNLKVAFSMPVVIPTSAFIVLTCRY